MPCTHSIRSTCLLAHKILSLSLETFESEAELRLSVFETEPRLLKTCLEEPRAKTRDLRTTSLILAYIRDRAPIFGYVPTLLTPTNPIKLTYGKGYDCMNETVFCQRPLAFYVLVSICIQLLGLQHTNNVNT
jgi:hypothetical protein